MIVSGGRLAAVQNKRQTGIFNGCEVTPERARSLDVPQSSRRPFAPELFHELVRFEGLGFVVYGGG